MRALNTRGIPRLHHIAYAVRSTDAAIEAFRLVLHPQVELYRMLEPSQNVFTTYLRGAQETHRIELVEPAGRPSPVDSLLDGRDSTLYHTGYEVDDFDAAIERVEETFFLVTEPFACSTDPGMWAAYFFHPSVGVIEILGPRLDESDNFLST